MGLCNCTEILETEDHVHKESFGNMVTWAPANYLGLKSKQVENMQAFSLRA